LRIRLKEILQEKGISITRVAKLTKLSKDTVWRYVHNKVRRIDLETLRKIAEVLNMSPDDLIELEK